MYQYGVYKNNDIGKKQPICFFNAENIDEAFGLSLLMGFRDNYVSQVGSAFSAPYGEPNYAKMSSALLVEGPVSVVPTSDAFPDPEDQFAIWVGDLETGNYYVAPNGKVATFEQEDLAKKALKGFHLLCPICRQGHVLPIGTFGYDTEDGDVATATVECPNCKALLDLIIDRDGPDVKDHVGYRLEPKPDVPKADMKEILNLRLPGFYLDARGVYGIMVGKAYITCEVMDDSFVCRAYTPDRTGDFKNIIREHEAKSAGDAVGWLRDTISTYRLY